MRRASFSARGGVTLYSKGFQPYFQQFSSPDGEVRRGSTRRETNVLGEGSILIKNNIFNSYYELFFFLIYEARKKKSPKRKKKHVFEKIASSVLTELGTFTSPLGEVAVVLAEQATNNQTYPLLRERIEHSMRSIASVLGEGTNQTIAILRALSSERRKSGGKLWYQ